MLSADFNRLSRQLVGEMNYVFNRQQLFYYLYWIEQFISLVFVH